MKKLIIGAMLTLAIGAMAQSKDFKSPNRLNEQKKEGQSQGKETRTNATNETRKGNSKYSLEQAMSDKAQLHTIAFNGLAFITGDSCGDTFMPPGKVADFFGFQYMRDIDVAGYGHNTTFLTRAANNILTLLTPVQLDKLAQLAQGQALLYQEFAFNRYPLMVAFRRELSGQHPSGKSLDQERVAQYTAALYKNYDAPLSYQRAVLFGEIAQSLSQEQKATLDRYQFNDYNSWTQEDAREKARQGANNTEFVAMMTYASEFFSWYKGSIEADTYFCPERHGTYFGGFFMKDYPAMNNPNYFISTAITGDSGAEFLATLSPAQRQKIVSIPDLQRDDLQEIASIRRQVSTALRQPLKGGSIDSAKVYSLIERYGYLDGRVSALYATRFAEVNQSLSDEQRQKLKILRNLEVSPQGGYRFSRLVDYPEVPNTDFLFGIGSAPSNQARFTPPANFLTEKVQRSDRPSKNRPR